MTKPVTLNDAIEWARGCDRECSHSMYRLLADAASRPALPARLFEEDMIAIAEALHRDGAGWFTGKAVQVFWEHVYTHLSASPKAPPPKPRLVWVVRASWSQPEARVKVFEWESRRDAELEAEQQIRYGAISVNITEEMRP